MKNLYLIIFILIYNCLNGQNNFENINLTIRTSIISGYHSKKPIQFPIGYTDASITPSQQSYNLGYDLSAEISTSINRRFNSGIIFYLTQFSFKENGDELSYWTNDIFDYSLSRAFNLLGIGFISGFNVIDQKLSKLSISTGLTYEMMLSNRNIILLKESENNSKYSVSCSIDYTHRITQHSNLLLGLLGRFALRDYFSSINYRPNRYGLSIGMEMKIIKNKRREANNR